VLAGGFSWAYSSGEYQAAVRARLGGKYDTIILNAISLLFLMSWEVLPRVKPRCLVRLGGSRARR